MGSVCSIVMMPTKVVACSCETRPKAGVVGPCIGISIVHTKADGQDHQIGVRWNGGRHWSNCILAGPMCCRQDVRLTRVECDVYSRNTSADAAGKCRRGDQALRQGRA